MSFSQLELEELCAGYSAYAGAILQDWEVPGAAIAVIHRGEVVDCRGYGLRDIGQSLPVDGDTIFGIASISKSFTAGALALLVERGQLVWDRPLRHYLPAFQLYDAAAGERITPRDLVSHRSGLPRHDSMWYGSPLSRAEIISRLKFIEPTHDLRATYQYQNMMFMVAGALLEGVTGEHWSDFVRREIFAALEMQRSNFSVKDSQKDDNVAYPHRKIEERVARVPFLDVDELGPAGSINASAADLAKWLIFHMQNGCYRGRQWISAAALEETHTPQSFIRDPFRTLAQFSELTDEAYGMGWFLHNYRGHKMVYHTGGIDGFTSMAAFLPVEQTGVVILTNLDDSDSIYILAFDLFDRLLRLPPLPWNERFKAAQKAVQQAGERAKALEKTWQKPGTRPSHPLEDYAGEYEHPAYGVIQIEKDGEALKGCYHGIPFDIEHWHYDVFELVNEAAGPRRKVKFSAGWHGEIEALSSALEPGVADIVFTRRPGPETPAALLQQWVGDYDLNGLDVRMGLNVENKLLLTIPGQRPVVLSSYGKNTFRTQGYPVRYVIFLPEENGKPATIQITLPDGLYTAQKKI